MTLVREETFSDTEMLSHALRHTNVSAMQLNRGYFQGSLTQYSIDHWSFQHVAFNAGQTTCCGDSPSHATSIVVPLHSDHRSRLLGKNATKNTIGLYGKKSEHADISFAGDQLMVVVVPDEVLEINATGSKTIELLPETAISLKAQLRRLQTVAMERPEALAGGAVKRCIVDALTRVLGSTVCLHDERGQAGRPEVPRSSVIRRVREALELSSGEPIFLDELSKAAGVSEATLRRIFNERYGLSPGRYLLLRRYYLARARLQTGEARTVRDAAEACGFWDLSRFSAGYRDIFGELPSRLLSSREGFVEEQSIKGKSHAPAS